MRATRPTPRSGKDPLTLCCVWEFLRFISDEAMTIVGNGSQSVYPAVRPVTARLTRLPVDLRQRSPAEPEPTMAFMDEPTKPGSGKEAPEEPTPLDKDRLLVFQQYIDDLKEIIRKLRERFH